MTLKRIASLSAFVLALAPACGTPTPVEVYRVDRGDPAIRTALAAVGTRQVVEATEDARLGLIGLAGTCWELDHVIENGERQSPFLQGQCIEFDSSGHYHMHDGCNDHCCWDIRGCRASTEVCQYKDPETGKSTQMTADDEFTGHVWGLRTWEIRDGHLWWFYDQSSALIFRSTESCPGSEWCPPGIFSR